MPGVEPMLQAAGALTGTDTFAARVYPRNEFVQTNRIKTNKQAQESSRKSAKILTSLILAQNERWRRDLGMQVERGRKA